MVGNDFTSDMALQKLQVLMASCSIPSLHQRRNQTLNIMNAKVIDDISELVGENEKEFGPSSFCAIKLVTS